MVSPASRWVERTIRFSGQPGDLFLGNKRFRFYLPITTSLIFSIVVSLLIWLFRK